jgi:nucleoside-diphosphate-sugar epimerase
MNPYGQTKITGEEILEQLAKSDPRWAVGILRYFNPAGAHGSALIGEDPSDIPNNLMPYIARLALGDLDCLSVFGDDYATPDGTGVRDYIHVDDLAQGHALSLAKLLETGQGHLVNLGTGQGSRSTAPMRPPVAGRCLTKSPPVVQAMYRSIAPTLHRRARCWALRPRKIWRPCAPPAGPGSRDGAMGEGGGSSVLAMRRKRTLQSLVKWFKVGQEMHRNCAPFP